MLFKGNKIKKLLTKYSETRAEKDELKIISELQEFGKPAIEHTIELFQHKKIPSKKAQILLEKLCDDSSRETIFLLIGDPYDEVRRVAKEMIINRWNRSSWQLLIEPLTSPDLYSRNNAIELLCCFKDPASVGELVSLFNSTNPDTKKGIIKILSATEGQTGKKLIMSALNDEEWQVRLAAVKSLGKMQAPESVDPLIEKLADKDPHMKTLAMEALDAIADKRAAKPMIALLKDDDLMVRQRATDCLIHIADSEIVPDIINLMRDDDVNIRRCAVEVLKNLKDPRTADELLKAMKDSDWWVRQIATTSLTELEGDNNIINAFLTMIRDPDENVRRCAVEFFNKVTDPAAFEPLLETLKDEDWWVREKAIRALGALKDPRAIDPLLELVDTDREVGWVVPSAIAMISGNDALDHLKQFLTHDLKRIKIETIKILNALKAKGAVENLKECLQDPDEEVRNAATKTLKNLTGKVFTPGEVAPAKKTSQDVISVTQKAAPGSAVTEAILILDLCNSTDIANRYGDSFSLNLMQQLSDMVTPIAQHENYKFMKGTGDGYLMTFPKAANAVNFAKNVLKTVADYNSKADDMAKINLRFAVNFGEAKIDEKGDRLGVAVSMAFRVEGVKPDAIIPVENGMSKEDMPLDNRTLVTENVVKEIENMKEFDIRLVGLFELKGITGLHRIFSVTWNN